MFQLLLSAIPSMIKGVTGYVKRKQDIAAVKANHEAKIEEARVNAKIARIERGDAAASELDMYFVKNNGWKDDISFYVFMAPAILAFIPEFVPVLEDGFKVLDQMPDWYKYTLAGMLIAVWGYRRMLRPVLESVVKKFM